MGIQAWIVRALALGFQAKGTLVRHQYFRIERRHRFALRQVAD